MARILYSTSAENDLLETWPYVAEHGVTTADHMLDQIEAADIDAIYPVPHEQGIVVARVLHHARDIQAIDHWPAH